MRGKERLSGGEGERMNEGIKEVDDKGWRKEWTRKIG